MKIAAIQMCSVLDPRQNLEVLERLLGQAKASQAQAVFLPECFYSFTTGEGPTPYLVEQGNQHFLAIKQLAKKFQLFLLGGSAATRVGDKIYNRVYNFSPDGELLATYDKIHLFSLNIQSSEESAAKIVDETHTYSKGSKSCMIQVENWKVGIGVCFDMRFPEFLREYSRQGAQLISLSAAFTVPTGKAHWHTLLKARAIENQCYVVAAAQWGEHNAKMTSYGHALIIDPWGKILAEASEGESLLIATLDANYLKEVRARMSVH